MKDVIFIKSLEAKLTLTRETIPFYQSLKEVCAVHEGVTSRISFQRESVYFNKKKVAIIKVSRKNISIYLALDPVTHNEFGVKDVTDKKSYKGCPLMIKITSNRALRKACRLLEETFAAFGATNFVTAEEVDYNEVYAPKSFDELLALGLIKKYVKKDNEQELDEEELEEILDDTYNVHLVCKLMYRAKNNASDLYIITNTNNWDFNKAYKMTKVSENEFVLDVRFDAGTNLEFKVSKSLDFTGVEKGIWNEEVKNHKYVVDKDLVVEDLIHNF